MSSSQAPVDAKHPSRILRGALLAATALAALACLRLAAQAAASRHAPSPSPPRVRADAPPRARTDAPPRLADPAPGVYSVAYLNSSQTAGPYPVDFSCFDSSGNALSCSPNWCASSSAVTSALSIGSCIPSAVQSAAYNYSQLVSSSSCMTCTASSDPRCTTAFLTALFSPYPSVFAAFCNNNYLTIFTSSAGSGSYYLDSVPNPPGGTNSSNSATCKTRTASLTPAWKTENFPLSPVLYPSASLSNNYGVYTGTVNGNGGPLNNGTTTFWLPASGRIGVTLSGQEMYPVFNNRALFTNENCESDACNAHIGQGLGQPHLHGDPFGPTCHYNSSSYVNSTTGAVDWTVHPPIIGIADDGLWIYGRYLSTLAPGGTVALDLCGGHSHGAFGYHYHTQVIAALSSGQGSGTNTVGLAYPQTSTGPLYCFKGNLSADSQYGKQGPGIAQQCCGASQYYVRAGTA